MFISNVCMNWYVLYVKPKSEKKVAEMLHSTDAAKNADRSVLPFD